MQGRESESFLGRYNAHDKKVTVMIRQPREKQAPSTWSGPFLIRLDKVNVWTNVFSKMNSEQTRPNFFSGSLQVNNLRKQCWYFLWLRGRILRMRKTLPRSVHTGHGYMTSWEICLEGKLCSAAPTTFSSLNSRFVASEEEAIFLLKLPST